MGGRYPLQREGHDAVVRPWAAACAALPALLRLHPDVPQPREAEERASLAGGEGAAAAAGLRGGAEPAPTALPQRPRTPHHRKVGLGALSRGMLGGEEGESSGGPPVWMLVIVIVLLLAMAAAGISGGTQRSLKRRFSDLPGMAALASVTPERLWRRSGYGVRSSTG